MDTSKVSDRVSFPTRRLGHVNLLVTDVAKSMAFYQNVLGFEDVGTEYETDAGFVSNGNTHHDFGLVGTGKPWFGRSGEVLIDAAPGTPRTGLNHLGWEVDTDEGLMNALKRAKAAKLADQFFTAEHTVTHSIYMADPDGNIHEFYADIDKNWRRVFGGGAIKPMSARWTPDENNVLKSPMWHPQPEYRHVADAPIHPLRTSRAVMVVSDVKKLTSFYTDVGGLETIFTAPDGSYAVLRGRAPGRDYHCALIKQRPGLSIGCHHASCEMQDEQAVRDAEGQLAARRIPILKTVDNEMKRSFFVKDPDGFLVEFFVQRRAAYETLSRSDPDERVYLL
jgi:catechol 2,3-dioxygenase